MEKLLVLGSGPGDESMLAGKAKDMLKTAQRILNTREMPLAELLLSLKTPVKGETAVLVSGDCGFFSVTKTIIKDFSNTYEIEVIPGVSSVQYLSAKIKVPYDDAAIISLHGKDGNIVPKAAYNKSVFALTGGANGAGEICRTLCHYGLGSVVVSVGERLSYPDERIVTDTAANLKHTEFGGLSVMHIKNPAAVNPHIPLNDSDFIRGEAPMTKQEVRWLSIQKLGVLPRDVVCDIGAGTGSVAVEMARKAFDGFVYAIESKQDACALARKNAAKHGAFNIEIINGEAPGALENRPAPDKAFIGGSSGNMDGIIKKLVSLNPNIKIVATAITLQTLHSITEGFENHGVANTDIICVNIAASKKTGGYDMMMAQNPVYIITGIGGAA